MMMTGVGRGDGPGVGLDRFTLAAAALACSNERLVSLAGSFQAPAQAKVHVEALVARHLAAMEEQLRSKAAARAHVDRFLRAPTPLDALGALLDVAPLPLNREDREGFFKPALAALMGRRSGGWDPACREIPCFREKLVMLVKGRFEPAMDPALGEALALLAAGRGAEGGRGGTGGSPPGGNLAGASRFLVPLFTCRCARAVANNLQFNRDKKMGPEDREAKFRRLVVDLMDISAGDPDSVRKKRPVQQSLVRFTLAGLRALRASAALYPGKERAFAANGALAAEIQEREALAAFLARPDLSESDLRAVFNEARLNVLHRDLLPSLAGATDGQSARVRAALETYLAEHGDTLELNYKGDLPRLRELLQEHVSFAMNKCLTFHTTSCKS
jgi:hypothetical protein